MTIVSDALGSQERLSIEDHEEFCRFLKAGLTQYKMSKADLVDQPNRPRTEEELFDEKIGILKRRNDPLNGLSREQMRRYVENALVRPPTANIATWLIWKLINANKAIKWRWDQGGTEFDPWLKEYWELHRSRKSFVSGWLVASPVTPTVRGFINPYDTDLFVSETLEDLGSLIKPSQWEQVKIALKASIETRAEKRCRAMWRWAAQAESMVDVRVYEGPQKDEKTGVIAVVQSLRIESPPRSHSAIKPFEDGEREPRFYERLKAIMLERLDHYAETQKTK